MCFFPKNQFGQKFHFFSLSAICSKFWKELKRRSLSIGQSSQHSYIHAPVFISMINITSERIKARNFFIMHMNV